MALFTLDVKKLLYELNFSSNTKFLNVFLNTVDLQSLCCWCSCIQNFQVWETIAVLISSVPTTCFCLRENITIAV